MMRLFGIDVSHWNGDIDWPRVHRAGASFAIAKATQGKSHRDKKFLDHFNGAEEAGLVPGAYHFFNFSASGRKEADNFLSVLYKIRSTKPCLVALDLEWPAPADLKEGFAQAREWIRIVEGELDQPVIVYTAASFWQECGNPAGFTQQPLWIAHHSRTLAEPKLPQWARKWDFWQHTGSESVPGAIEGVKGNVDLNWFSGTEAQLKALGSTSPLPDVPVAPTEPLSKQRTRVLQLTLNEVGASPSLVVDGIWGPKTEAAWKWATGREG